MRRIQNEDETYVHSTFKLIHTLISGYLLFYLTYYVVSLLSGFITAIFIIDT